MLRNIKARNIWQACVFEKQRENHDRDKMKFLR